MLGGMTSSRGERVLMVVAIFGAGALGALGGTWARPAPPEIVRETGSVVDLRPVAEAIGELREAVRHPVADPVTPRLGTRDEPVRRSGVAPTPGPRTHDAAAVEAASRRVVAALHTVAERLEDLASENHRSAQLVEMIRGMEALPRRIPPRWDALEALSRRRAPQELGYATPVEIVRRFGYPTDIHTSVEDGLVVWSYETESGFFMQLEFHGGHVVGVNVVN